MWKVADARERLAMSFLVSLGGRRGAFSYPSLRGGYGWMRLKDVTCLADGTASLVVYPGEAEEYRTLISPEAVQQLDLCLQLRERVGEKLAPDSPVLRDGWHSEYAWYPEEARPLGAESVTAMLRRLKAGITTTSLDGGFKATHGFRKFQVELPGLPPARAYGGGGPPRPPGVLRQAPWDYVREHRAAVPHLVIDERFRLETKVQTQRSATSRSGRGLAWSSSR